MNALTKHRDTHCVDAVMTHRRHIGALVCGRYSVNIARVTLAYLRNRRYIGAVTRKSVCCYKC